MRIGKTAVRRCRAVSALLSATVTVLVLLPGPARGGGNLETINLAGSNILNRFWDPDALPIRWHINQATENFTSPDVAAGTVLPAVQAAFDSWEAIPTSSVDFEFDGSTTATDAGLDGVNLITFFDSDTTNANPCEGFVARSPSTALTAPMTVTDASDGVIGNGLGEITVQAVTFTFPVGDYPAGSIVDADIIYNLCSLGPEPFSTNDAILTFDLQTISVHEQGHFHGLSHSPLAAATMFPFVDTLPVNDGGDGFSSLEPDDIAASSRYYPEPSFGTNFGRIRGGVTIRQVNPDTQVCADAVHVVAVDAVTFEPVVGRFSLSRFIDPADVFEGSEAFSCGTNVPSPFLIDGLPAGDYHVYVEYFDRSEFLSARLDNAYNTSVANSTVADGGTDPTGAIGFLPQLAEFFDSGESENGGDSSNPGTAADNSDAAAVVSVATGSETTGVNIAINMKPGSGSISGKENPTDRSVILRDTAGTGSSIAGLGTDGGGDDFLVARYTPAELPAPPFNVAESLWGRWGISTLPFTSMVAFGQVGNPDLPDLANPVAVGRRVITGGPEGKVGVGDLMDVRDQWNVTVNQSRNVFIVLQQPAMNPGICSDVSSNPGAPCSSDAECPGGTCRRFLIEGFFPAVWSDSSPSLNSLLTEDGGASFITLGEHDLLSDLVVEAAPPVMLTALAPATVEQCTGGVGLILTGVGFQTGADVDFGPGITVTSLTVDSPTQISLIADFGAAAPVGERTVVLWNPEVVFPNHARLLSVDPTAPTGDCDGDGAANGIDCNPDDPSLLQIPEVVGGVHVTEVLPDALVGWLDQTATAGAATTYDLVTGNLGELQADRDFSRAACLQENAAPDTFLDGRVLNPGDGVFYLLRGQNTCGDGTYGSGNSTPDPRPLLDTSGPCL
jgi:hypothetical protein